jgi:hypothetical protein
VVALMAARIVRFGDSGALIVRWLDGGGLGGRCLN